MNSGCSFNMVVKLVVQPGLPTGCIHDTAGCQPVVSNGIDNRLNNNNNNNNQRQCFWCYCYPHDHGHCESSPGSFDECRLSAGWPPTLRPSQPTLAVSPPINGCYHPHPPSTSTIAICYYYSAQKLILILPSHGGWKAESI